MSDAFVNILIAEDNDVSREMMTSVLRTQGYQIYGAIDGESAIKVIEDRQIDLALVDINMAPKGGLDFVKHLVVKSIDLPVVIVTSTDSSHVLMEATALGVKRVLQKPITPDKLIQTVQRLLKQRGINPQPLAVSTNEVSAQKPEDLMKRAIELAEKNAQAKRGGPFGAIVADETGRIVGEGVNGHSARVDPTAHAEVMAMRQAAERLGTSDLSNCTLYCSSQPTMVGQAVISSVGIKKVYFGLSHDEVSSVRVNIPKREGVKTKYSQLGHDLALSMFRNNKDQI